MEITKRVKVVIADDDPFSSEFLVATLEALGHEVVGRASDGAEAVELTSTLSPDVLFLDVEMPTMTGIEAAQRVADIRPTATVILTSHESREVLQRASAAGVGAYLVKPPKLEEVERALVVAIARFQDLAALRRLTQELAERNKQLEKALADVKQLRGLLPICAACHKIRQDDGYWQDVSVYLRENTDAELTHGLCPTCVVTLYPEDMS